MAQGILVRKEGGIDMDYEKAYKEMQKEKSEKPIFPKEEKK